MRRLQRPFLALFVALLALPLMAARGSYAGELTEAEFRRLHAELQPDPDAPWMTIPWKISLLDAQQAAVRQQKPIFIWAMDGHPLGCT